MWFGDKELQDAIDSECLMLEEKGAICTSLYAGKYVWQSVTVRVNWGFKEYVFSDPDPTVILRQLHHLNTYTITQKPPSFLNFLY